MANNGPPSITDIISQFALPPDQPSLPAQEWLNELSNWLENGYEKMVHGSRSPGLHASGLSSVCARREVINETFGTRPKKNRAGNFLTYDVGHAMHFWWQHRYLGPKQELWGDWKCAACPCLSCSPDGKTTVKTATCESCHRTGRKVVRGFMPMNCECGTSWQDSIRYLELSVVNEELGYVGHTDGILVKNNQRRVFEFKTSGPNDYDGLTAPKPEHVIQAHAYMNPLGLNEALIVYQSKAKQCDWLKDSNEWIAGPLHVKPFVVVFDPIIWKPIEQRIRDHHEARALIQRILDDGDRPTRDDISKFKRVCESPRCNLARFCPVQRECFNIL